ncbi:RagB/SusD family nutrient uptake outer membrane protein [Muricauda sp. CAU 1633]|uniref:RagB/SusD family nutrient uptake outer membrane protein n=1 Tax=Allomuricauda sp. CAU 1633 TaxID=2816036 RepID=UPI001A8C250A|nr:RagB/SusD family nutrient uptake outer membrane protein [Muricauda sp. CAU 1633]MBO0323735.1 RagB/SusD family nutrient uptake outer membrane protein [Muricauda sp. CAU 1633]
MKRTEIITKLTLMVVLLGCINSCTDLETTLYSELTPDTEYTTENTQIAAILTAYAPLAGSYGNNGYFEVQELSTETSAAPAKFGPWDDGGIWARLHRHEWENNAWFINNTWNMCFSGIATCNRLIEEFEATLEDPTEAVNELRALRAFYYFTAMDLWGDVPLVTSFAEAEASPSRTPKAEVYNFITSEFEDLITQLPADVGGQYYGRWNRWAAMGILARVYLNAEVYTGTPQYQKVLDLTQQIIDGGQYSLVANYMDNFTIDNTGSSENIMVVVQSKTSGGQFNMHMRTLHPLNRATYNFTDGPWNGYTALEEFYNSFDDADNRKEIFITGQQFTSSGEPINDPNGAIEVDSQGNSDPDGTPLIFTPYINELFPFAFSQSGARIGKYEFENGIALAMDNDFPIIRFSEILLMRAEALWRSGGNMTEAEELVRQVRERAGLAAISPLTEDALYDEIQRELAFEAQARTIMIRFDRFTSTWWEKTITDPNKNVFPIPTAQLNGNPNLTQNPGY